MSVIGWNDGAGMVFHDAIGWINIGFTEIDDETRRPVGIQEGYWGIAASSLSESYKSHYSELEDSSTMSDGYPSVGTGRKWSYNSVDHCKADAECIAISEDSLNSMNRAKYSASDVIDLLTNKTMLKGSLCPAIFPKSETFSVYYSNNVLDQRRSTIKIDDFVISKCTMSLVNNCSVTIVYWGQVIGCSGYNNDGRIYTNYGYSVNCADPPPGYNRSYTYNCVKGSSSVAAASRISRDDFLLRYTQILSSWKNQCQSEANRIFNMWVNSRIRPTWREPQDVYHGIDARYVESILSKYAGPFSIYGQKPQIIYDWTKLASAAYMDLGMCDSNGLMYMKEAGEMGIQCYRVLKDLKELEKLWPNKKGKEFYNAARFIATAFLSSYYGTRLTATDTRDYYRLLAKGLGYSTHDVFRCQASTTIQHGDDPSYYSVLTYFCFYKKYQDLSNTCRMLSNFLDELDIGPTLDNAWDAVKYSFVIDWFTNVGDNLTAVDNLYRLTNRYTVLGSITAAHTYRVYKVKEAGLKGTVKWNFYSRRPSKTAMGTGVHLSLKGDLDHIVQGSALVVQRC